jgi:hypothetical protein
MSETSPAGLAREQRLSALCANACGVIAVTIPAIVVLLWAVADWRTLALFGLVPSDIIHHLPGAPHPWQQLTGAAITLVPALIVSYGLLRARRSLSAYARGEFFNAAAPEGLRGYAAAFFWAAVASIVSVPVLSVAMTFANAPGTRELTLDLSGAQVLALLGSAIVWVIASVMVRASGIVREHATFV